jgi:hypothetical protein
MNRWPAPARCNRLLKLAARREGLAERDGLMPVTCRRCGDALGLVVPGAEVWCRRCAEWASGDDAPPQPEAS